MQWKRLIKLMTGYTQGYTVTWDIPIEWCQDPFGNWWVYCEEHVIKVHAFSVEDAIVRSRPKSRSYPRLVDSEGKRLAPALRSIRPHNLETRCSKKGVTRCSGSR